MCSTCLWLSIIRVSSSLISLSLSLHVYVYACFSFSYTLYLVIECYITPSLSSFHLWYVLILFVLYFSFISVVFMFTNVYDFLLFSNLVLTHNLSPFVSLSFSVIPFIPFFTFIQCMHTLLFVGLFFLFNLEPNFELDQKKFIACRIWLNGSLQAFHHRRKARKI